MFKKFNDVRSKLQEFSSDNMKEKLPLLKELLDIHHSNKTEVDIERAYYITDYYKRNEKAPESMQIKRAKSVSNYLSKRDINFLDSNLLGGNTTGKALGAPLYPEFFGLSIWPELSTISTRKNNPQILDSKDAEILNKEVFPYWLDRSISEEVRKIDPVRQSLFEKMVIFTASKAATISHTTPCYEIVLKKGLNGIIQDAEKKKSEAASGREKDFYDSVQISMKGIIQYANNISKKAETLGSKEANPETKKNYLDISEICKNVPANPPKTFREAVNALWICQVGVFAENSNMAINPGRLDQILYPYFIKDYNNGSLTIEEALKIAGSLWFKIADNVNLVPEAAEKLFGGAGAVPAITLGGVDKDGNDAVNELTYVFLKVTELLPIRDPNVNARYFPGVNSKEYRNEVSRVIMTTKAIPAFFNDKENISTLLNQGETLEHARDYSVIGCVELGSAGRDYSASSSIFMMLYTVLYMTLHNGKTTVTGEKPLGPETGSASELLTFDDFWLAYEKQSAWMVENAVTLNNNYGIKHQEFLPTPLLSSIFEGPMNKGKDLIDGGAIYNSSGVTHIGFADVCDSICAIKEVCFNKNTDFNMSLSELVEAVDCNFKGYELLKAYLQNKAPKYGTSHPVAIEISKKMIELEYDLFSKYKNYRGGNYRVAYWTMTNHAGYGLVTGALPNGREANQVFSSGITPASQINTDLTTALNSVAELNSKHIPGAYALNMKYSPLECSNENIDRFGSVVEAYMENGGQQVQFNVQDYQTLIDAKANPEKYPDLLVRVSGYSAYFKSLNEGMKDELITRSQYNLKSGEFISLKSESKKVLNR